MRRSAFNRVGGADAIRRLTASFYDKMFADVHLDRFVRSHDDPHAERLALWLVQKLTGEPVWDADCSARPREPVELADGRQHVVVDRTSAHVAAWHSAKRQPGKVGRRFKLDDCRIWMRLFFWAARETGVLQHGAFREWAVPFIGHFIAVYERSAPPFVADSLEWSADPVAVQRYLDAGRRMDLN